ncbi:MAG: hypothetical protein ACK5PF_04285 [bacterium]|jgi:hypothetical protein
MYASHHFFTPMSGSRLTYLLTKEVTMKPASRNAMKPFAALLAATCVLTAHAQTFNSGSTGADGALNPTVNTEIQLPESGILNYTSINIPTGVTVSFRRNTLNTPVVLLVQGNVTVAGRIHVNATGSSADVGSAGDGVQADDGNPGRGGPGGFDGGRGGGIAAGTRRGGTGLGPGGAQGGAERVQYYLGTGANAGYSSVGGAGSVWDVNGLGSPGGVPVRVAAGGSAYGSNLILPLIGGSGGGGGAGDDNSPGSGGGGGGGALLIASSGTINVTGRIEAYGGWSGHTAGTGTGSTGGGGSGGAIKLMANSIAGNGVVEALGGCRKARNFNYNHCQEIASAGRVRLEANTITRTSATNPAASVSTPGPIFIPNSPAIRIASIAGQAVPVTPTGNADITLPSTTTTPVTVQLTTTNVPLGNTISVTVKPANADATSVVSPAISGTLANGTTSVQVTLPAGPSIIQAQTTYTVVAALGNALSNFANNERVERLEIAADLGGSGSRVQLVTVSGKKFDATPAALALIDTFNAMQTSASARVGS